MPEMPSATERDIYLHDMTDDQARQAWKQVADIMLNGGEYEAVGHDQLDGLASDLLRVAGEWAKTTVRDRLSDD